MRLDPKRCSKALSRGFGKVGQCRRKAVTCDGRCRPHSLLFGEAMNILKTHDTKLASRAQELLSFMERKARYFERLEKLVDKQGACVVSRYKEVKPATLTIYKI